MYTRFHTCFLFCKYSIVLVLVVGIGIFPAAAGLSGQKWAVRYSAGQGTANFPSALAVDADGNVYVSGRSIGPATGWKENLTTIKYDASGNQLWEVQYKGVEGRGGSAVGMVLDPHGNVYVAGVSGVPLGSTCATIKYDLNGEQLWLDLLDITSVGSCSPVGIAIDSVGNPHVAAMLGNGSWMITKYAPDGKKLWIVYYPDIGTSAEGSMAAFAIDEQDNVVVTGSPYTPVTFYDYLTVKYDANGNKLWAVSYDSPSNGYDLAAAITTDAFGNVYVIGQSDCGDIVQPGGCATVKYDPDEKSSVPGVARSPRSDFQKLRDFRFRERRGSSGGLGI